MMRRNAPWRGHRRRHGGFHKYSRRVRRGGDAFGKLRDPNSYYALGHDDFKLADFCDGYIYQMPFKDYKGVTTDPLFVTDKNLKEAVENIDNPDWRRRVKSPADILQGMREDADIPARLKEAGLIPQHCFRSAHPARSRVGILPTGGARAGCSQGSGEDARVTLAGAEARFLVPALPRQNEQNEMCSAQALPPACLHAAMAFWLASR